MALFRDMSQRGLVGNTITYNTLIQGLCQVGDCDNAQEIFKQMVSSGLAPDFWTYNILLDGLCNNGKCRKWITSLHKSVFSRRPSRPKSPGSEELHQGPYTRPSEVKAQNETGFRAHKEGKPIKGEEATTREGSTARAQNRSVPFSGLLFELRLVSLISCHSCTSF
ncbi:hypothetical protein F2Q68_00027356 [Brassica cretica]|uniref:Pentatricopeptide repeat-containing protein n=1 Tax=Brassica cretica TaxID=69181 RepID=A0A8S9I894_BRACR|nr:hypothetical protein F2Q68_00027356 [Brassica cretica]